MVKGKGSPHLMAKKVEERRSSSRHKRRAEEAIERKIAELKSDGMSAPAAAKLLRRNKGKKK